MTIDCERENLDEDVELSQIIKEKLGINWAPIKGIIKESRKR